jgi:hypothetical protein
MSSFNRVAAEIRNELFRDRVSALVEKDPEWQRVNTYIADVLKDSHTLYAKLTRLQSDFDGKELEALQVISEGVLKLGDQLSVFAKNYYEGKLTSAEVSYGDKSVVDLPAEPVPVVTEPSENAEEVKSV